MSQPTEPRHDIASVLVIAADPNIESLVGELVAFAGHRPLYDVTAGAAGESVRRARPDVTMVDTALDKEVVRACLSAADEVGSRPVLMSSTASSAELLEEARAKGCLFFPLPGGPKPLERLLQQAIGEKAPRVPDVGLARSYGTHGSVHPALCAALARVSRARAIQLRSAYAQRGGKDRSAESDETSETQRSVAALRAAVTDYSRQLFVAHVTEESALRSVRDAVSDCAAIVGADLGTSAIQRECEMWTRQVFVGASLRR